MLSRLSEILNGLEHVNAFEVSRVTDQIDTLEQDLQSLIGAASHPRGASDAANDELTA